MSRTLLHAAVVLTATASIGLAVSPLATAATWRDTSAGGACHPAASGPSTFARGNNYITNVGTAAQYVICHFPMDDVDAAATATTLFQVAASSTQSGRSVVCSAQTGAYYQGVNHITSNNVQSITFAAPGHGYLFWDETLFKRYVVYDVLTLNCRLDPGTRIGLIEYAES